MPTPEPDAAPSPPDNRRNADHWQAVLQLSHDVNNLLGAIVGYSEMLIEDLPPGSPLASDLGNVLESAQRASALVTTMMIHARRAGGDAGPTGGTGR